VAFSGCVATLLAACASAPRVPPPATPAPAAALDALPADAFHTQKLLRAQYDGPEGRASFKLVLRLETPERYDLAAVDAAGRSLWRLLARGDQGLFEETGAERFCRLVSAAPLPGGLGLDLPLDAIPRLLLARLPLEDHSGAMAPTPQGQRVEGARRWTWSAKDGELSQWTLWNAGQPSVWWSRREGESLLSVRARATQVHWREAVSEPLREPLGPLTPSAGFEEGACARDLP
jgi:hypothetical protein